METVSIFKINDFKLDARSDKKVWNDARELLMVDSVSGKEVGKKARAKISWSDTGLYLLFVVDDDHIWGTYKENDDPIYNEEVVECFVAWGDKTPTEYFEFQFSPNGVKFDAKIKNPTGNRHDPDFNVDVSWNAQNTKLHQRLEGEIRVDDKCKKGTWITEVYIPWSDLGWDVEAGQYLRTNLFRIDGYPEQSSFQAWKPTLQDPPNFHVPEKFGLIKLIAQS